MTKTYTANQLMTLLQISRGVLYQYRTGYYRDEPLLIKGQDWDWNEGKIAYYQTAIDKIKEHKNPQK